MAKQPSWNNELHIEFKKKNPASNISWNATAEDSQCSNNANLSKKKKKKIQCTTWTMCFAIDFRGVGWTVKSILYWSLLELPGLFWKGPHIFNHVIRLQPRDRAPKAHPYTALQAKVAAIPHQIVTGSLKQLFHTIQRALAPLTLAVWDQRVKKQSCLSSHLLSLHFLIYPASVQLFKETASRQPLNQRVRKTANIYRVTQASGQCCLCFKCSERKINALEVMTRLTLWLPEYSAIGVPF